MIAQPFMLIHILGYLSSAAMNQNNEITSFHDRRVVYKKVNNHFLSVHAVSFACGAGILSQLTLLFLVFIQMSSASKPALSFHLNQVLSLSVHTPFSSLTALHVLYVFSPYLSLLGKERKTVGKGHVFCSPVNSLHTVGTINTAEWN